MNLNGTLLGQMIAFGLFIWFCWKFVWPPLLAAMEERANKIEQGLKDSEDSAKKIIEAEEQSKKMIGRNGQQKVKQKKFYLMLRLSLKKLLRIQKPRQLKKKIVLLLLLKQK